MPTKLPTVSEAELISRAGQGEIFAYGILYDRYLDSLYRYIYYRVSNHEEAEDLTETVFLKAWETLPRMRTEKMNFRAWLYRIAHNLVVDYYRTRKPNLPLEHANDLHDDAPTPETNLQVIEEGQQLSLAIARLKPDLKEVLVCRFISGMSHAETAKIMGLAEGHVRVLQHRALRKIRKFLTEKGS